MRRVCWCARRLPHACANVWNNPIAACGGYCTRNSIAPRYLRAFISRGPLQNCECSMECHADYSICSHDSDTRSAGQHTRYKLSHEKFALFGLLKRKHASLEISRLTNTESETQNKTKLGWPAVKGVICMLPQVLWTVMLMCNQTNQSSVAIGWSINL